METAEGSHQERTKLMTDKIVARLAAKTNHLGSYNPSQPEWHELRKSRIGGSEVGAIAGESRYESAYSLWAKKLDLISGEVVPNSAMYWGSVLEAVIITEFEKQHPELTIFRDVGTFVDKEHDFMLANPDAIYEKADGTLGVIEVKTARFVDDWANGVPRYYVTQVQWYLNVLGLSEAYVVVLFSGSDYQEFEIKADKMWQEHDFKMVCDFVRCLETGEKPDWDGSEATLSVVRRMHPQINANESYELEDLGMHYDLALTELEAAKTKVNELQARVLDAMGTAREGTVYGLPVFMRTSRNGGTPYLTRKRKS
jgi:putative phage-type endonuclease